MNKRFVVIPVSFEANFSISECIVLAEDPRDAVEVFLSTFRSRFPSNVTMTIKVANLDDDSQSFTYQRSVNEKISRA